MLDNHSIHCLLGCTNIDGYRTLQHEDACLGIKKKIKKFFFSLSENLMHHPKKERGLLFIRDFVQNRFIELTSQCSLGISGSFDVR